jgi:hypothetical protein
MGCPFAVHLVPVGVFRNTVDNVSNGCRNGGTWLARPSVTKYNKRVIGGDPHPWARIEQTDRHDIDFLDVRCIGTIHGPM